MPYLIPSGRLLVPSIAKLCLQACNGVLRLLQLLLCLLQLFLLPCIGLLLLIQQRPEAGAIRAVLG
jgi:hypothetical protein